MTLGISALIALAAAGCADEPGVRDDAGTVPVVIIDDCADPCPPVGRRVIARGGFPQARMGFVRGSDQVYTMRQDSTGYVYLDVWQAATGGEGAGS